MCSNIVFLCKAIIIINYVYYNHSTFQNITLKPQI